MLQLGAPDCEAAKVYVVDTAGLNVQPVTSLPETPAAGVQEYVLYTAAPADKPIAADVPPTQIVSPKAAKVRAGPGVTVTVTGVLEVSHPVKVSSTAT